MVVITHMLKRKPSLKRKKQKMVISKVPNPLNQAARYEKTVGWLYLKKEIMYKVDIITLRIYPEFAPMCVKGTSYSFM